MKASITGSANAKEAEQQLRNLIAKREPKLQPLIRAVRRALRKRFPTAEELAYDYSNSLVISYSPTERGIESVVTIAAGADGVRLFFNGGPKLPDPKKILLGSSKMTRFIWLESAKDLTRPVVKALLAAALAQSKYPLPKSGTGRLVIKSSSALKRKRGRS